MHVQLYTFLSVSILENYVDLAEEKKRLQAQEEAEKEKVRQERKQKKNANKKKKDDTTAKEDIYSPVKKPGRYICFEHT